MGIHHALPGRYVLGELVDSGGMAEVFAGYAHGSHGFQKPVAIKRLLPEHANDEGFVARLIAEAKLLVGMQHSNVVSVLDLVRDGHDVFVVMEYVDGPSLRQLVKALPSTLSLGLATYVVHQAAAGLAFAHSRRGGAIIHADVSLSNLLLTTSGEVRVADFGIARREGVGSDGVVEGNYAYMSPEQMRAEPLTAATDMFSLGVVLYQLVTGHHPFGMRHADDETLAIEPPATINAAIPPALDALCMRALAMRPADRFACMQDMIDGLAEIRFANGLRDGATELARLIRDAPGLVRTQATQHTAAPVPLASASRISRDDDALAEPPPPVARWRASEPSSDDDVEEPTVAEPPLEEPTQMDAAIEPTLVLDTSDLIPVVPPPLPVIRVPFPRYVAPRPRITTTEVCARRIPSRLRWMPILGAPLVLGIVFGIAMTRSEAHSHAAAPRPEIVRMSVVEPEATPPPVEPEPVDEPVLTGEPIDPMLAADELVQTALDAQAAAPLVAAPIVDAPPRVERKARRVRPVRDVEARGALRVETEDGSFASVTLDGARRQAPGARFEHAPGTVAVVLENAAGTRQTCTVTIEPRTRTLTVSMQTGACRLH